MSTLPVPSLRDEILERFHTGIIDVIEEFRGTESRLALVSVSMMFLAEFPNFRLEDITSHPDMPKDIRPYYLLASLTDNLRMVFWSSEWDVTPEGAIPPEMSLAYTEDPHSTHGVCPLPNPGNRPQYTTSTHRCPHCENLYAIVPSETTSVHTRTKRKSMRERLLGAVRSVMSPDDDA